MKVGIIAEQKSYNDHRDIFKKCNIEALKIESLKQLEEVDGLLICGNDIDELEALINKLNIYEKIFEKAKMDFPIMGISSAMEILIKNKKNKVLFPGIIDMEIQKKDGPLEVFLKIPVLGAKTFKGVFTKKLFITKVAPSIGILSQINSRQIVFIRQGNFLAACFHPELTDDIRVHEYFVKVIKNNYNDN